MSKEKNIESVKNRVSRFAMCLKLLLKDDTTGCLYRIGEKPDSNSIFNTFDIFSFNIFYFQRFFLSPNFISIIPSTQLLPKINTQLSPGSIYINRTSSLPSIPQYNPKGALSGETVDIPYSLIRDFRDRKIRIY